MTKKITAVVIVAIVVALIIYDIVIVIEPTPGDTISVVIAGWAHQWFVVPLFGGVVMGHFFWPWDKDYKIITVPVMSAIGIAAVVLSFLKVFIVPPMIPLLIGIPIGHFMWPQKSKE